MECCVKLKPTWNVCPICGQNITRPFVITKVTKRVKRKSVLGFGYFIFTTDAGKTSASRERCFGCDFLDDPDGCLKNLNKLLRKKKLGIIWKCKVVKGKLEKPVDTERETKPKEYFNILKVLKKQLGKKMKGITNGYAIKGFIDNREVFKKAMGYGLITKTNWGQWVIILPEEKEIEGKTKTMGTDDAVKTLVQEGLKKKDALTILKSIKTGDSVNTKTIAIKHLSTDKWKIIIKGG